jgi:hypothetical protein
MTIVGSKFVSVSEAKYQAEASYRYQLTRVREYGESIALLGGEVEERAGIDRSLAAVLRHWRELCHQHMKTTVVSQGSCDPDHPVLAKVSGWFDVARPGHAGCIRLHHRAGGVLLAGRHGALRASV